MRRLLTSLAISVLVLASPTVAVAEPDTTAPRLVSISADPQVVSLNSGSAVVWVDATITDDNSGVMHDGSPCGEICYPTGLELFSPSRQRSAFVFVNHVSGDLYRMGVRLRDWDERGTYRVEYAQLTDNAGNTAELFAEDLEALGLNASVEVTNQPPVEHVVSVSLLLKKHLNAGGTALSLDSDPACTGLAVEILRLSNGTWRRVSSTVTNRSGQFSVKVPDRSGKYRADVKATVTESGMDSCLAGSSKAVKHVHR